MGMLGNILNKITGKSKSLKDEKKYSYMDLFSPFFSGSFSPELNATYVSAVVTHARHVSKAKPMVRLKEGEGPRSKQYLNRLMTQQPNPTMSAPVLWKTLGHNYFMNNLAIAYLEWDEFNITEPLKGIWPLDFDTHSLDCRIGVDGKLYVGFTLNGERKAASLDDLVILVRQVDPSSIFGKRSPAVNTVLKVMQTQYEGIEQAIRTSAFIRFIVTSTTPLSNEMKEERARYFASTYLSKDSSGVVYVDAAQQIVRVDSQAKYANAAEMKLFKDEVLAYLGINDKIIRAEYSEDEWQAYYESALEPFFIELEAELTNKIFTRDEINRGNHIEIDANRLHSASLKTRKDIAESYMKLPVYRPNTVCDLLFLPRLENGDKEYATLNYVNANKQDEYQGVGTTQQQEEGNPDATSTSTDNE